MAIQEVVLEKTRFAPHKMGYEEFLAWGNEDTHAEWDTTTEDDDRVESQVLPGFWLRPTWLWQVDKLNPLTCILQIEGVAEAVIQQIKQSRPE